MNIEMLQYIEISIFGIVILLTLLFSIKRIQYHNKKEDEKLFIKLLVCNIIILLCDIGIYLLRWHTSHMEIFATHIMCIVYFVLHSYFGYLWLRYCIKVLFPDYVVSKKLKVYMLIPCIISFLLIITSPWTKWIYYLTSANRYGRGAYLWVTMAIAYFYWVISGYLVVHESIVQKRIRERSVYTTLLIFPIPTVIGNFIQVKYYGLSVVWVCSALSLLILFINLQNYQLSRDILTGLFNRRQTDKHITWEIDHLKNADYLLFSIMIDVDHFKKINDEFGHLIGDNAINVVANVLRKSCREKDFIGRFGGDEFIIIGHVQHREEVEALICTINQVTQDIKKNLPYKLSLSAGYAIYDKNDAISIDCVISEADKNMYKIKEKRVG